MSKAKYVEPELNIIALEEADILTASTDSFDGEYVPIGGRKSTESSNLLLS